MEIKKLDELQKLNVVKNEKADVELCSFTCLITCSVTSVPVPVEKEQEDCIVY